MTFMFKNLHIYQRAVNFADTITQLTQNFPKGTHFIVDQLNRASLSISLNIAEGNGRWHKNDRKQFFFIARGSCHECVPILEICFRRGLVSSETHVSLHDELVQMAKMISALIAGAEKRSV